MVRRCKEELLDCPGGLLIIKSFFFTCVLFDLDSGLCGCPAKEFGRESSLQLDQMYLSTISSPLGLWVWRMAYHMHATWLTVDACGSSVKSRMHTERNVCCGLDAVLRAGGCFGSCRFVEN